MYKRVCILILFISFIQFCLISQTADSKELPPTPSLTPEQIALYPTDKWFTAERPDYSELDERVKSLAKNEETPEAVALIVCEGLETDIDHTMETATPDPVTKTGTKATVTKVPTV